MRVRKEVEGLIKEVEGMFPYIVNTIYNRKLELNLR